MASQTENLTAAQLEARKENARKSTGPRTAEGKRRSSQNARKHGLYSNANFFWDAAIALGEDPRDFERLLKGLVLARQPADGEPRRRGNARRDSNLGRQHDSRRSRVQCLPWHNIGRGEHYAAEQLSCGRRLHEHNGLHLH